MCEETCLARCGVAPICALHRPLCDCWLILDQSGFHRLMSRVHQAVAADHGDTAYAQEIRLVAELCRRLDEAFTTILITWEQVHLRFQNEEMDFMFNWVLGMGAIVGLSHGEIFYAIAGIKDGDAAGWREGFRREGHYLRQRALDEERQHRAAAGHSFLGA